MIAGIALGFAAALCQSLSYLFSRRFVVRCPGGRSTLSLLILGHLVMGAFSLALIPLLWPRPMPTLSQYAGPLVASAAFYLLGQSALFLALRGAHASRVSPLLGMKVFMLAFITLLWFDERFSMAQWLAVLLSVAAAALVQRSGGRMSRASFLWVVAACVGYSLSDLSIKALVGRFMGLGLAHASAFSVCLCYLLCGVVACLALGALPRGAGRYWPGAVPFALAWFGAMLFLFACFASIGVVFGNIIQSSRGVISVVLGSVVAAFGMEHIERRAGSAIWWRRAGAAGLMTVAIALFYLGA